MLGPQPVVAEPIGTVDGPRTALDAVEAVETELGHVLAECLGRARDVDPAIAHDVAGLVTVLVRRGGKRLRSAFAWCRGRCAGLGFQLRDDLLGTFGNPEPTGGPAGAEEAADALAPGAVSRSDDTVERMRAAPEWTGARAVVESEIEKSTATSLRHLTRTGADPAPRQEFPTLVEEASGIAVERAGEAA